MIYRIYVTGQNREEIEALGFKSIIFEQKVNNNFYQKLFAVESENKSDAIEELHMVNHMLFNRDSYKEEAFNKIELSISENHSFEWNGLFFSITEGEI